MVFLVGLAAVTGGHQTVSKIFFLCLSHAVG